MCPQITVYRGAVWWACSSFSNSSMTDPFLRDHLFLVFSYHSCLTQCSPGLSKPDPFMYYPTPPGRCLRDSPGNVPVKWTYRLLVTYSAHVSTIPAHTTSFWSCCAFNPMCNWALTWARIWCRPLNPYKQKPVYHRKRSTMSLSAGNEKHNETGAPQLLSLNFWKLTKVVLIGNMTVRNKVHATLLI